MKTYREWKTHRRSLQLIKALRQCIEAAQKIAIKTQNKGYVNGGILIKDLPDKTIIHPNDELVFATTGKGKTVNINIGEHDFVELINKRLKNEDNV